MVEAEAPSRDWIFALIGAAALIFAVVSGVLTWQLLCAIPALVGLICLILGFMPSSGRTKSRRFRIGMVSLFLAFVIPLGVIQYAIRLGYPIKVIVPDGFKGKVWIVIDKAKGQTPQLVDGVWVFDIPPSGTLYINDEAAFNIGHEEDYYFASGQRINVISDDYGRVSPNGPLGYWAVIP